LGGCRTAPESRRSPSSEIFEDIPAPRSARVQTDKALSFSYRSDSFRCAKYVYKYSGEFRETVEFFRDVMTNPPYSWDLRTKDDQTAGPPRLTFRKSEEYCTIDIRDLDGRSKASGAADDDLVLITICVNYE